jgi:hypothetical protein
MLNFVMGLAVGLLFREQIIDGVNMLLNELPIQ